MFVFEVPPTWSLTSRQDCSLRGSQGGCLYKNARAGSFPKEQPGTVIAKPSVWGHWYSLCCLPLHPWLIVSFCPSTANVSPSETLQGLIESQGPPLESSAVVSPCLRVESASVWQSPEPSLHSQKLFCNMLATEARPEYLASWAGRKSPEASSFGEAMEAEGNIPWAEG